LFKIATRMSSSGFKQFLALVLICRRVEKPLSHKVGCVVANATETSNAKFLPNVERVALRVAEGI